MSTQAINPNLGSNHPTARSNGKVFFNMDGGSWVCSGAVINSVGFNTVWTAGHCIHGGPGSSLATNWSFVPAYDDDLANPRPHGTWTARELWTWSSWIDSSNWEADMAVAIMNTRNGVHIVNQFGGHGFRTHQGFTVGINNFGYPSGAPFDGGNLLRCSGNSTQSGARIRINCDLTAGQRRPVVDQLEWELGLPQRGQQHAQLVRGTDLVVVTLFRRHRVGVVRLHRHSLTDVR
ncbi:hypothetical protein NKG94_16650 [Micromonospora sp. M12]